MPENSNPTASSRFQLVHRATGLTLGEYKSRYPLSTYFSGGLHEDSDFQHVAIRPILRGDGAIGFQRLKPWYDEGELYFLCREDWEVVWR